MSTIIFAPKYNTGRKKDATGAFLPEARAFAKRRGGHLVIIDNRMSKKKMREQVLRELCHDHDGQVCSEHSGAWSCVAFFCHGYSRGIQLGFTNKNVHELAARIATTSHEDVRVPLYCCSTASTTRRLLRIGQGPGGDGGFADLLRDDLCRQGARECVVDAHVTVGHTTRNPHVRRFSGDGSPTGGIGGTTVIQRRTELWRPWIRALRTNEPTPLRFDFPFMTIGEIHKELLTRGLRKR